MFNLFKGESRVNTWEKIDGWCFISEISNHDLDTIGEYQSVYFVEEFLKQAGEYLYIM